MGAGASIDSGLATEDELGVFITLRDKMSTVTAESDAEKGA